MRKRADPHGGLRAFGDAHHQIDRLRAIDRRPHHQRGIFAGGERIGQRLQRSLIRRDLAADAARRQRLRGLRPVVDRHRNESRSARRLHRGGVSPRDRGRHVLRPRRLDAELDVRPRKLAGAFGVQERVERQQTTRLLAGDDHQRRLVAVRGVDRAQRIAEAGGGMQIGKAGVAGGLRKAVGHADHARLLQAEYVVDVVGPVAQEWQFGGAGIAEDFVDAEAAQQIEGDGFDGGGSGDRLLFLGRQARLPGCRRWSAVISLRRSIRSRRGESTL